MLQLILKHLANKYVLIREEKMVIKSLSNASIHRLCKFFTSRISANEKLFHESIRNYRSCIRLIEDMAERLLEAHTHSQRSCFGCPTGERLPSNKRQQFYEPSSIKGDPLYLHIQIFLQKWQIVTKAKDTGLHSCLDVKPRRCTILSFLLIKDSLRKRKKEFVSIKAA